MNHKLLQEMWGKAKFEKDEFVNKAGDAMTAGFRLLFLVAIVIVLSIAHFLKMDDDAVQARGAEYVVAE